MQPLPNQSNVSFVESLFADYIRDPGSLAPQWRAYFDRLRSDDGSARVTTNGPSYRPSSLFNPPGRNGRSAAPPRSRLEVHSLQDRIDQMVRVYRVRGHLLARLDPLGRKLPHRPELKPKYYGFTKADLDHTFSCRTIAGNNVMTLREILTLLRETYCRSIGVQFMHIDDLDVRHWLQDRMEGTRNRVKLSRPEQIRILTRLTDAAIFEEFIQKKYVGAKRFSLEGAESLIPLLDLAIERAGENGVEQIVLGMAHRGRLNVLANIMGKSPRHIFREFEDVDAELFEGRGDVKHHLGYSSDWRTASGQTVHLSLCFNPSHLEFVNPVAVGRVRAKQARRGDPQGRQVLGILIHGDASFPAQGVVQETLNLSELTGYSTGGTLHLIVNNQIGFTTTPEEGRSSLYASGVAKMLQIPIFHVNGENPEAVAQTILLAMDFREQFHRDVVIDMYCYRRHGHNEMDEPAFTQPVMARLIEARCSVREGYLRHLLELGEVTREEADQIAAERREQLEHELSLARGDDYVYRPQTLAGTWEGFYGGRATKADEVETAVDHDRLAEVLRSTTRLPVGFRPHPKVERMLEKRRGMAGGDEPLDWAAAEALALATVAADGHRVRLTGQDTARGTFSHRHAILYDYEDGRPYVPLQHVSPDQAPVEIINSPLSETAALGFEYGFSLDWPDALVVWEAQFGDFCNAAQVIIDQFIASAEDKWQRLSGIVLLLPHGFEGQGPEHSSARLERFLVLAAEDNIQVVNLTTPAQYFHCLRRQVLRQWRKPLVVMSPKSLLRHPSASSQLEELTSGSFAPILPDHQVRARSAARIVLCSGKIFYELQKRRQEMECESVAILRLEQLCPLHEPSLEESLRPYPDGTPVVWVQEEPENMGAWRYLHARFGHHVLGRFPFSGIHRPASASPATGSSAAHKLEQETLLNRALSEVCGTTE